VKAVSVGVVTDSVADLPEQEVRRLGIGVVPLILRLGSEEFRDGVDLTPEQFYERLRERQEFPLTATPSPADFAEACERQEAGQVLVITVSAKLSSTIEAARQAGEMLKGRARVEVLDSGTATLNEGFIVMRAAEAARAGASLEEVREAALRARARVDFLCTFDTLEYLRRGGRIGAAAAFLGSLLRINPLINLRDGLVQPAGRTRSRASAVDRLFDFASGYDRIEELAVEHTACPEEAEALAERLSALHPRERIYRSTMTPVIGAHTGPGLLLVGILGDRRGSSGG
jgi:DegV family protein with EDD domain